MTRCVRLLTFAARCSTGGVTQSNTATTARTTHLSFAQRHAAATSLTSPVAVAEAPAAASEFMDSEAISADGTAAFA